MCIEGNLIAVHFAIKEKQATHLSTVDALSNWVQDSLAIGRGSNRVANVGNSSAEKPPLPPPCDANDGSDGFMTYFVDSLHWPWVRACILGLFAMHLAVGKGCYS